MRNYWTCTKFADWLRGTNKPHAETSKGWAQWKRASKEAHPFRYWLAEEGLDIIQNIIYWPYERLNDVRYYINNRFVTRTHCLTAHPRDISRGTWCDVGNRFLPCLFNELVDFVEIELAGSFVMWDEEAHNKYNTPFWRRWYRVWRNEEAAMAYIEWAKKLTNADFLDEDKKHEAVPTRQAEHAAEIEILYKWWKYERPTRPDPYDASGWSAICEERRKKYPDEFLSEDRTDEEREQSKRAIDALHELEQKYEEEDEQMMIRLIKIRHGLWT